MACKACAFFMAPENATLGVCRRYPPVVVSMITNAEGKKSPESSYPYVMTTNVCGEFKVRGHFAVMHTLTNMPPIPVVGDGDKTFDKSAKDTSDTHEKTTTTQVSEGGDVVTQDDLRLRNS